jgi:hypothetical protein
MVYVLIPLVMERATRAEKHLTRSGALRSLVSKEFWFFLVNLLLLLALGKAALSATVQQAGGVLRTNTRVNVEPSPPPPTRVCMRGSLNTSTRPTLNLLLLIPACVEHSP